MSVARFLDKRPEQLVEIPFFQPKTKNDLLVTIDQVVYRECPMCCEKVRLITVGACPHALCIMCCVRLRVKQKKRECEYCKTPSPQVAVTSRIDAT